MPMHRKNGRKKSSGPSAPAWMVTYSDMVTLLLTFFVLLLSMSRIDQVRFEQAADSLQGAFGIMRSQPQSDPKPQTVIVPEYTPIRFDMLQQVYRQIQQHIEVFELDEDIELVKDRGAIVLRIKEKILFDVGATHLKDGAGEVLRRVGDLVSPLPFDMRIEGHADATPFRGPGRSNWDISAERAISVLKFFAKNELIPLDRLSAVGYGEKRPIAPNDTPENRALNRRVEFMLESTGADYRQELPYLMDASEQLPF